MVDFFFVLSGFVLAMAFWTNTRAPKFVDNALTRIARLYPLHIVTLCAVAVMQWYLVSGLGQTPFIYPNNDGYHFALNLVLLQSSGLQHGFSFNAPSWSISTEFLVNLLFLGTIAAPRNLVRPLCLLIVIASLAVMAVRGVINGTPAFGWISNDLIRTSAGFFVGVLSLRLHRRIGEEKNSITWDIASVVLFSIAFAYLASNRWSTVGDMLLCYLIYPAAILSVIRSHIIRAVLRMRPMVYLGEISYSIYLVHFPLLLGLFILSNLMGITIPASSHLYFIGFLLITVAMASVTYRWVETPGRRFFSQLVGRSRAVIPAD